jgi:hypothetical protein
MDAVQKPLVSMRLMGMTTVCGARAAPLDGTMHLETVGTFPGKGDLQVNN